MMTPTTIDGLAQLLLTASASRLGTARAQAAVVCREKRGTLERASLPRGVVDRRRSRGRRAAAITVDLLLRAGGPAAAKPRGDQVVAGA